MALSAQDWQQIQEFVNRIISKTGEAFIQGKVVKSDPTRRVVWLREFGDTPIPLIGFDYRVKYRYKETDGTTTVAKTKPHSDDVEILTPRVGDTVLVAQQFGTRRLPKCLGVIKSVRYVESGE